LEVAGVLLITSVTLVIALVLLTIVLMSLLRTTRKLEVALKEEGGARARMSLLLDMASAVNSSLTLDEVLNVAMTHAGEIVGAVAGAIYLSRTGSSDMRRDASYRLLTLERGSVRTPEDEPLRSAVVTMRPALMKLEGGSAPTLEGGGHPQYVVVVPIARAEQLMGAIELYLPVWHELTDEQRELLNGFASEAAIAIRHAQLFHAHEENALTDDLTGLPNRRALAQRFLQEIQRGRRHHQWVAFLMIDLDDFKRVNDAYGHLTGDAVLAELAEIFTAGARETDVCARYGGDEFAMVLHETTAGGARALAERIRAKVDAATFTGGVKLTVSIGVAATDDPEMFASLLERADQALYAAKQTGRNRVSVADMYVPVKQLV
jgi:diguanylate cyclase (GGDEF)-like protein